MLPSTSIASLPDVAGNPKHIDNPFLWIASKFSCSLLVLFARLGSHIL
jgi:hypothetical protein